MPPKRKRQISGAQNYRKEMEKKAKATLKGP
jgi:hypothetical protein